MREKIEKFKVLRLLVPKIELENVLNDALNFFVSLRFGIWLEVHISMVSSIFTAIYPPKNSCFFLFMSLNNIFIRARCGFKYFSGQCVERRNKNRKGKMRKNLFSINWVDQHWHLHAGRSVKFLCVLESSVSERKN